MESRLDNVELTHSSAVQSAEPAVDDAAAVADVDIVIEAPEPKRRGRPPGAKDTKPRQRRKTSLTIVPDLQNEPPPSQPEAQAIWEQSWATTQSTEAPKFAPAASLPTPPPIALPPLSREISEVPDEAPTPRTQIVRASKALAAAQREHMARRYEHLLAHMK